MAEVNSALDALSLANVTKDRDGAKKALGGLLRALGPTESKWLIRIILKVRKQKHVYCMGEIVIVTYFNYWRVRVSQNFCTSNDFELDTETHSSRVSLKTAVAHSS